MKMKKGFTLVEVTVALAIFGIAVVVLTQSFLGGMFSLESFKFDNSREEALRFIYNRVIRLEKRGEVEKGGVIETIDVGEVKWEARVEPMEVEKLYRIGVRVFFQNEKNAAKSKEYLEEFYVYRPGWSDEKGVSVKS